jgi:hypothetical protein
MQLLSDLVKRSFATPIQPAAIGVPSIPFKPNPSGSVSKEDAFYQSPEYKAFQNNPSNMMGTMDVYNSPYFGQMGSGSIGRAQDAAYMQYKNSLAGQIPAAGLANQIPEAAPVAGLAEQIPVSAPVGQMPEVGPNILFGGSQVAPQQEFQNAGYAPQSIGAGLFGGQFQNLMMQQPQFYNPLMGFSGAQNFGGLFGQQQNAMTQYRGSNTGYLMPPPQQPQQQQQFSPQTPAFFDSLAYRPL